ncbi:response regulator transcription factor [Piscinibacter sp. Jin2]|uniref:Response regulator transcription factor n=1 Tax=Aquariibacter lacus TaxID=2801332 RepID=A0A9X1BS93_9BURK|nr:response regulator transcription factor [Piscinibacter lacus]MBL0720769.1 response regulator transcription factor [Piscinibacter lacus]
MHLLLLEDDIDLGQAVLDHLEAAGHAVQWMKLIAQAEARLAGEAAIELALFDLQLPDGDATELLRRRRAAGDRRPVIVLTARDQISDRIRGLQAGADDYLVKPFDLDELLARIEAVARRSGSVAPPTLQADALKLDFAAGRAWRGGEEVLLTAMEWALLARLASRPGQLWSRSALEQAVYTQAGRGEADSNSVEVLISRLRRKLGAETIRTQRGLGYRFEAGA